MKAATFVTTLKGTEASTLYVAVSGGYPKLTWE
jgi:hypothetical protein